MRQKNKKILIIPFKKKTVKEIDKSVDYDNGQSRANWIRAAVRMKLKQEGRKAV